MSAYITKLSGYLIFLSFFMTLISYFFNENLLIFAGIFAWVSFLFLFKFLKNKKMIIILLCLTFVNLFISYIKGYQIDFLRLFIINQYLLALLVAVSFLRLIATFKMEKSAKNNKGVSSFFNTYFGVHLFGSVINLSSLVIVADNLYKKANNLSNTQIIVLTRSYSSDAFWSPFFVAFAAALTYLPNFDKSLIILNGLIFAFFAFIITYLELRKDNSISNFEGYPINFSTIYVPFLLAFSILLTNYINEDIKVIVLVSLYSLLLTSILLLIKNSFKKTVLIFDNFISTELEKMKMELSLFLVAGMFGVSVSTLLVQYDISSLFQTFTWINASVLLLVFTLLAFIGIHPIITIAVIGDIFVGFNHTLLAVVFLIAWSTTTCSSPFSGLNLTLQARYNINAKDLVLLNLSYAIKIYIFAIFVLYILDNYIV